LEKDEKYNIIYELTQAEELRFEPSITVFDLVILIFLSIDVRFIDKTINILLVYNE